MGKNTAGTSDPSNTATATTSNLTGTTPTAPVGLGGTPAGPAQVFLNWVNTAANQTNFVLTRATDSNFTQNVVIQTLPSAPFYYTDTAAGIEPGEHVLLSNKSHQQVRPGLSSSNIASVTIPLVPPQPTNAGAVVLGNQMDVSWVDHAGPYALDYQIFRSVDGGAYVLYANLPETSDTPPTTLTYVDSNIPLGHVYSYEIEAHNVSGYSAPAIATGSNLGTATLNLDAAGNLTYTSGPGVSDQLILQLSGGIYTLTDPEVTITATGAGAASISGTGTSSVTFPSSAIVAMTIRLCATAPMPSPLIPSTSRQPLPPTRVVALPPSSWAIRQAPPPSVPI